MASSIGLKRAWFQNPRGLARPHYDLNPRMREAAVKAGAKEVDCRVIAQILRDLRK